MQKVERIQARSERAKKQEVFMACKFKFVLNSIGNDSIVFVRDFGKRDNNFKLNIYLQFNQLKGFIKNCV